MWADRYSPPFHIWRVPAAGDSINSNEGALPVAGIELIPGALEFTVQEWIYLSLYWL